MASYMPQDVFDMCVVSAVKIHMVSGDSLGQVCSQICGYYKNSYPWGMSRYLSKLLIRVALLPRAVGSVSLKPRKEATP